VLYSKDGFSFQLFPYKIGKDIENTSAPHEIILGFYFSLMPLAGL